MAKPARCRARAERLRELHVSRIQRVRVHAQCHRRVRVTKPAGDGADIVTARDRGRRSPVTEIMQPPSHIDARLLPRSLPPPSDPIRIRRPGADREEVRVHALAIGAQRRDLSHSLRVESQHATVGSLRRRVDEHRTFIAATYDSDAAVNCELASLEVEVRSIAAPPTRSDATQRQPRAAARTPRLRPTSAPLR